MKKALVLMTGLFVSAAVNVWALSIDSITVTGATNASGAVTVSADISGVVGAGYAVYQVTSSDGLSRRYFQSGQVAGGSWSDSNWIPYFTGTFIIDVNAWDYSGTPPDAASTTVTVTRAVSGTVNSIKYSSTPYTATGVWNDVDISAVKLHDTGMMIDFTGVGSIGCNLLNANVGDTHEMTEEQRDIAYTDTVGYKPAGTPYRFDVSLHARPRGFMGMGEIKRWIWTPADTNVPDGNGTLTVDITSCSPWRSSYSNTLQSHVGMAPLFAPASFTDMPTGMIFCTSAHYMDVGPTNTGTQAEVRCGLRVNGHTGTNSYLKMFLSDTFLQQQFGLTNVYDATNMLAGFVQHFDTNGAPIDSVAEVTVSLIRVEGGTNILYDYDSDGVGDSGFEVRFDFEFQSAVAAQMGLKSATVGPTIRANGTTPNITVNYPKGVSITVEMNASIYAGIDVDWWVVAFAHSGEWYYLNSANLNSSIWTFFSGDLAFCRPVYQGALFNLSSTPVLSVFTLPRGIYDFWFAVDYPMDGILNLDGPILYDKVTVVVQ